MIKKRIRLANLAKQLDAQLFGDGDIIITGIASIDTAQSGDITFLKNNCFKNKLMSCRASAVVLSKKNIKFCSISALIVTNPDLAYAKIAQFMNTTPEPAQQKIASGAVVASDVILGKEVGIGPNTVVESGVILGDNVIIGPGSFIGKNTKICTGTRIWANVSIYHEVEIGAYCLVQSGAVIGSDGFGYANDRGIWTKIPQLGKVKIENHVEIGSCTTIDRGSLDYTYIGDGVIIDNQCHIAHNVIIDAHTAIAGGVIIGGSTTIGKYCMIGGASVINSHVVICDRVKITGMSMVTKSIRNSGIYSSGIPVQPNLIWRKTAVLVMHISNISKRIKMIERKLKKMIFLSS